MRILLNETNVRNGRIRDTAQAFGKRNRGKKGRGVAADGREVR